MSFIESYFYLIERVHLLYLYLFIFSNYLTIKKKKYFKLNTDYCLKCDFNFFAYNAYLNVFSVSSVWYFDLLIHAINIVNVFPPRDYFKSLVNFELRYGIYYVDPFYYWSNVIHYPKANKERFIFYPSNYLLYGD